MTDNNTDLLKYGLTLGAVAAGIYWFTINNVDDTPSIPTTHNVTTPVKVDDDCGCDDEVVTIKRTGPGYASPLDATQAPQEKLVYLPCVAVSGQNYISTVDVDPDSATYSTVISRLEVGNEADELHHTGWNICSSCHGDATKQRRFLVCPALRTGNIYIVDTRNAKAPKLHTVISGDEVREKLGYTWPHTVHCLGSGELMVSYMGDQDQNGQGGFALFDAETFEIVGKWSETETQYGYDFWYQPRLNVMASTEWGSPNAFQHGFDPSQVPDNYGRSVHFWDWEDKSLMKTIDLGDEGLIPLEIRFLHAPDAPYAYFAATLSSNVFLIHKDDDDEWETTKVIDVEAVGVEGWALPNMPGLITDILVSMDDRFIYFSNWLQGDIRQYNIEDRFNPVLVGRVFLGGSLRSDNEVAITTGQQKPVVPKVQGNRLSGAPQMIQLSLDGKRLYVTNSLFKPWDDQFYPDLAAGSQLLVIDVDNEQGGLSLNENFFVEFGEDEPWGPALAHEVRYPGGDCTSDIWI